jgi:DNA-binding PadR family transcriptional regulator
MAQPREFLPLAPVAFEVLLALAGRRQHGYGIIIDIRTRTSGAMDLATSTLYATLQRLEDSGLVAESAARVADQSSGPPRKYYELTRVGRQVALLELARLERATMQARRRFREQAFGSVR